MIFPFYIFPCFIFSLQSVILRFFIRYKKDMRMIKHNKEIRDILNDYLKIKKPGYAVLLKGPWGCGKTYFVKNWIENLKTENNDDEQSFTLNPIYVSLYGMTKTSQIDDELKRAISPILHSKAMRKAGKVFKLAISAALRYNIDFDENDNADLKLDCTIDPKALLGSNDSHVKGNRLLVFDDIERSKIDILDVLGYINYYVEHIGCNVILIGNVDKVNDKLQDIKEKTIGREFEINPDVDVAINSFVQDESLLNNEYLSNKKDIVKKCFRASKTNNLRILKQSLNDFSLLIDRIPANYKKSSNFEKIKLRLLVNFVVVYAEEKGQSINMNNYSKKLSEDIVNQVSFDLDLKDEEEPLKSEMIKIQEKYEQAGLAKEYCAMAKEYVDIVMSYLYHGKIDFDLIDYEMKKDEKMPWEILKNYLALENEELTKNIKLNADYLKNGNFKCVDEMLSSALVMLMIINRELTSSYKCKQVTNWCKTIMRNQFYGNCNNQNELSEMRLHLLRYMQYDFNWIDEKPDIQSLMIELGKVYQEKMILLKDKLTIILESLNAGNVNDLYAVYGGNMPDHSSYSSSAIFARVEPEKFVNGFVGLKNEHKLMVLSFIVGHYSDALNIENPEDIVRYYVDDLKTLTQKIELLGNKAKTYKLVDQTNILRLKEKLEGYQKKIKDADDKIKNKQDH